MEQSQPVSPWNAKQNAIGTGPIRGLCMIHRIRIELTAITLCAMVMAGCDARQDSVAQDAKAKGRRDAEDDIAQGILKEKEYPPLPYSLQEINYIKLLRSECGVVREVITAPKDSKEIREEVAGYNEVVHAELQRRFGADIIQKLRAKAEER
jgi:hypothetical protein